MKAVVIYYSKSGKTEAAAKRIAEEFSADLLKVEPAKPYGGFLSTCLRARKEKKKRIPVEMKTEIPDLSAYDTVFLGFPIWMSTMPEFLKEFIKKCSVRDKMLIPFCTSKKTSVISSITQVKECCPGANIKEGLVLTYNNERDYQKWVNMIRMTYL